MKLNEIQTYRDRNRAERATAKRSLFASYRGDCSQFEVRQLGLNGFAGGLSAEMVKRFERFPITAKWSAGHRC